MTGSRVLRFGDEDADRHDLVGGKGANLGLLTKAGFPVPPGFTVTVPGYADFLATDGLGRQIEALADGLDHEYAEELERVTAKVRDLITSRDLPEGIASQIRAAYAELGDTSYVAVRSSGTAEDLADASFAGMHDTYLDIAGTHAVLDAVKRCWASLWTARAASYRNTKGFAHSHGIAVVVQTMVPSEVSGVMFTANPMTAATDEIMINASWGLGEAIVSGITNPDEYAVAHGDLRLRRRVLGDKEKRVVRNPETGVGTIDEDMPAAQREQFSLTDDQARNLADLGRRVQEFYDDFPQDIEWGYANRSFQLLQSRPITGVDFAWDKDVDGWQWLPEEADDNVWTRGWSDNVWTGAITPLMYSFRARSFTHANTYTSRLFGEVEAQSMRKWMYYRGGAYYNSNLERTLVSNTAWPATRAGMLANIPPAWHEEVLAAPFSLTNYVKGHARLQLLDPISGVFTWRKVFDKFLVDGIDRGNGKPDEELRRLGDRQLVNYVEDMITYETSYISEAWAAFFIHARDSFAALALIVAKWYDGPRTTAFTDLITGTPRPTAAMLENAELWRLARDIRASSTLTALLEQNENAAFFAACAESEEGRTWLAKYDDFMARNGHRGHADRDVYYPRRCEDAGVDYRSLKSFMSAEAGADPSEKEEETEARRQAVIAEVAENIRKRPFGGMRVEIFKTTLEYVMKFLLFRDDERHFVDRTTFSIKRGYKEIGRRLSERGLFDTERDYFFLSGQELYQLLEGRGNVPLAKAKIAARMRNLDRIDTGAGTNPMYLVAGRDADFEYDRAVGEDLPDGVFRGIGTSGGTIEGVARVVKELKDIGRVRSGEIHASTTCPAASR